MTQEDKELLLKDLCARLPYGVMLAIGVKDTYNHFLIKEYLNINFIQIFKPYLRPMESMTEEEKKELHNCLDREAKIICERIQLCNCGIDEGKFQFAHLPSLDFCLSHHFDFRNLISKGLALEAPEGMYTQLV